MGLDMYLIKRKKDKNKNIDLWDFEEELIYWRKANMVHKFFCDNGEEIEEEVSYKISKENLEELLDRCNEILEKVKTKNGKVINGQRLTENGWVNELEDGKVIINPEICEELLPTQSGFFFGSTEYNEYYLEDIEYTKEHLEAIIDSIDFDNEECYYLASW